MKIFYQTLTIFLILTACSKKTDPINTIFQNYQGENPGASVAIIQDGKIVYHESFGMADKENQVPVQANSNFRLASVSKQITATAILILESRGSIDLDWNLDQVFEEFPAYGKTIKVHHLLNHTSGIWDYEDFVPDDAPKLLIPMCLNSSKTSHRCILKQGLNSAIVIPLMPFWP